MSLPPREHIAPLAEPSGELPLNIFEPRYLAMVDAALSGDRMIGMIQPVVMPEGKASGRLHQIGCAGRVTAFQETEDGRYEWLGDGLFPIADLPVAEEAYRATHNRRDELQRSLGQAEQGLRLPGRVDANIQSDIPEIQAGTAKARCLFAVKDPSPKVCAPRPSQRRSGRCCSTWVTTP